MKRVLVSGAGGYVGSIMCEELLKRNYEVYALDRFFFGLDKLSHIDDDNFTISSELTTIQEKVFPETKKETSKFDTCIIIDSDSN